MNVVHLAHVREKTVVAVSGGDIGVVSADYSSVLFR